MIRRTIGLFIIICFFYCCWSPSPVNIKGRYFLESDKFGTHLDYEAEQPEISLVLVDNYVFAAGYSDNFIVAIQHPKTVRGMGVDSNYYIVPFRNNFTYSPQDGIVGPLTYEGYKLRKEQLGIGDVTWVKVR